MRTPGRFAVLVALAAAVLAGSGFDALRRLRPSVLSRSPDTVIRISAQALGSAPGRETARLALRTLELRSAR